MTGDRLTRIGVRFGAPLLVSLVALGVPGSARAASFVVDDTLDTNDVNLGDCICADAVDKCTLRAAVQEANACVGADTVDVPAGNYVLTIAGSGENAAATGDLDLTDDVTLVGDGAATTIIDAGGLVQADRVIHVLGTTAVINGFTLTGGQMGFGGGLANDDGDTTVKTCRVVGNAANQNGGGLGSRGPEAWLGLREVDVEENNAAAGGGGIANLNESVLDVEDSSVHDNFAGAHGGGVFTGWLAYSNIDATDVFGNSAGSAFGFPDGAGGGIATIDGHTELIDATVTDNGAADGGGIFHLADEFAITITELSSVTVEGNEAEDGAGIHAKGGQLDVVLSKVRENTAGSEGGGMWLHPTSFDYDVLDTAIALNTASFDGGGVWLTSDAGAHAEIERSLINDNEADRGAGLFASIIDDTILELNNSTVSRNTASARGGGLWFATQPGGEVRISHATIAKNDAPQGGGAFFNSGGGDYLLSNTILADNTAAVAEHCDGATVTSQGNNLLGHDTGCTFVALGSDLVGTGSPGIDPLLGVLTNNGGPTRTHRLLPGSPAIDAGYTTAGPATDQRGLPRFVGAARDIGAFEVQ